MDFCVGGRGTPPRLPAGRDGGAAQSGGLEPRQAVSARHSCWPGRWVSGGRESSPGRETCPIPPPPTKAQNFDNFTAKLLSLSSNSRSCSPYLRILLHNIFPPSRHSRYTRRRPSLRFRTLLSAPRPSRPDLSGRIRSKTSCLSSAAASAQLQATRSASSASMLETTRASNMTAWPAAGPPAPWAASGARATGRRKMRYATDTFLPFFSSVVPC